MSDDLRTRIASALDAAMYAQYTSDDQWVRYNAIEGDFDRNLLADAVIRELGLQPPPGLQPDGSFLDPAGTVWRHTGQEWIDDPTYRP